MDKIVDHRQELTKLFKEAMLRHGLTKNVLQNKDLKHVFSPGYRKARQIFGVSGDMYCPELWTALGSPAFEDMAVFQYMAGKVISLPRVVFDLGEELDIPFVEDHFDLVVSQAIAPLVHAVQTPVGAIQFAFEKPAVLLGSNSVCIRNLRKWYTHYGLPFEVPDWDKNDEDDDLYPFS